MPSSRADLRTGTLDRIPQEDTRSGAPGSTALLRESYPAPALYLSWPCEGRRARSRPLPLYDRLPAEGRLRIVIRGANHFTFSDDGALLKSRVLRGVLRAFGKLGIGGRRQLAVAAYCVHSFFDAHLKGPKVSRLGLSSPLYPEIRVIE